jgi:hypothetical protein
MSVASAIAAHLGIFDDVIASDGTTNLAGPYKAAALVERFGPAGFDYAGNAGADLAVWACARHAIVVDEPPDVVRRAREQGPVEREFPHVPAGWREWRRMLRVHHWLKNLLRFMPMVAAQRLGELDTETVPFAGLQAFFELADASESGWEYTVSWIDCLSGGLVGDRTQGLFMRGRHSPEQRRAEPAERRRTMPFVPPVSLVNGVSLRLFNAAYYALNWMRSGPSTVHYRPFF